jgi:uncharacterized membrane protein YccC
MAQPPSFWTRHAALVFALKTFAAAMLAYSIALRLGMPRPDWAMASVFVTSSPLTGATTSKAVYRILGTLIGAAGTIVLIPNLVDAPELLCLGIALWLGIFLYLALIDATPRSYVFMLAGYSVALLGFPLVSTPELTFDTVVSRVQEITLGIICASLVSTLVLPQNVSSVIAAQAESWLDGVRRLGADVLTGRGSDRERDNERMRLAAAAAKIDELCSHLGYEAGASANTVRGLRRLRQHMLSLLPLLASIEDRTLALDSSGRTWAKFAGIRARAARWLGDGGRDGQEASLLRAALSEVQPALDRDAGWNEIMLADLVTRLRHLVEIMQDCLSLREAIADGRDPEQLPLAFTPDAWAPAVQHRDHGLALWSAAATALSVLACCAFWIATGWADGATAPVFAAIVGSFLAGADDPVPAFRKTYIIVLAGIAVTGIYMFGLLPRITTMEMLVAALMPAFVLFGWMAARPGTAQVGSLLAIFTSVQLALQSSYAASFASFANANIALMLGVALTGVICGIVRFLGSDWIAARLLRSNWRTLADAAEREAWQDRVAISNLMQHRLALLAARIAVVPTDARSDAANLRLLQTALSIIDARQASLGLSGPARAAIEALLARLAEACRTHTAGRLADELREELDSTIAFIVQELAGEARIKAIIALAGIRCGLFPEAPPVQPYQYEQQRMAA